jgi:hypothetical protein
MIWVHLPAAIWGAIVEWTQTVCPLTTLENHLRHLRGQAGYTNGFIEYHITRVLYPNGLTQRMQIALGVFVVLLNVTVYTIVLPAPKAPARRFVGPTNEKGWSARHQRRGRPLTTAFG